MPCKRITISLTEEQYDQFKEVLPAKANLSEVLADQINMFISATKTYGDEFILDVMCDRKGFSIQKKNSSKNLSLKDQASDKDSSQKGISSAQKKSSSHNL